MPLIRMPLIFSRFAHSEMLNAENLDPRFFFCLFVSVLKNDGVFLVVFFSELQRLYVTPIMKSSKSSSTYSTLTSLSIDRLLTGHKRVAHL